jgi:rhodanese-related sulfurtransferase
MPAKRLDLSSTRLTHLVAAVMAALALAGLPACSRQPVALAIDEVARIVGQPGVYLYDANPREMYDAKHLPGARWIEWDRVSAADLPADRNATLVFYCALEQCSASQTSAARAIALGYRRVFVMPAGILGWKKAGHSVEKSG